MSRRIPNGRVRIAVALSFAALAACVRSASSQLERYLCVHYTRTASVAHVLAVDTNGKTLGTHLLPSMPYIHLHYLAPAGDNVSFFTGGNIFGPHVIQRVSPTGPPTVVAQLPYIDWMVEGDEEGELFVQATSGSTTRLLTIRHKAIVRAVPVANIGWGACHNPATGHIAVNGYGSGPSLVYYDVDPATGVALPLGQVQGVSSPSRSFCYDPAGGGEYVDGASLRSGIGILIRVAASGGILATTVLPTARVVAVTRAPDGSLPTRYRLKGYTWTPVGHSLIGVDRVGVVQQRATLTDCSVASANLLRRVGGDPFNQRIRIAPNDRELTLLFPSLARRAYVVAFSLTGAVGRGRLGDGRAIPLAIDAFTMLALNGTLGLWLTNTAGVLDGNGAAIARVDANALGPALRGQRLWAAAAVLDTAAPSGVAQLSDPVMITFR